MCLTSKNSNKKLYYSAKIIYARKQMIKLHDFLIFHKIIAFPRYFKLPNVWWVKSLFFKINYRLINRFTHGASRPYINVPRRPRSLALYYVVTTVQGQLCETRLHNRYVRFRHINSISMYMEFPRTMARIDNTLH